MINITPDKKIFLFRFSTCLFVAASQFFACLVAKLIKDHSLALYNIFTSFTLGIILTLGVGEYFIGQNTFRGYEYGDEIAYLIPLAYLLCIYIHHNYISPSSAYNIVSSSLDDEIEMEKYLDEEEAAHESSRSNTESDHQSVALPPVTTFSASVRTSMAFIIISKGIVEGCLIGCEQHRSVNLLVRYVSRGALTALVFGVLCEETLPEPTLFLRYLICLVSALPMGIVIGSSIILEAVYLKIMSSIFSAAAAGLFTAVAMTYFLPLDKSIWDSYANSPIASDAISIGNVKYWKMIQFLSGCVITASLLYLF